MSAAARVATQPLRLGDLGCAAIVTRAPTGAAVDFGG